MVVSRQGSVSALAGYPMHHGRVNQGAQGGVGGDPRGRGKENSYSYSMYYDSPNFKMTPALGDTLVIYCQQEVTDVLE